MTCPVCGQAQPCAHSRSSVLVDSYAQEPQPAVARTTAEPKPTTLGLPAEPVWRHEVVSRVQQHRARRRRTVNPNAMELDFTADEPFSFAPPPPRFAEIMVKPEPKLIRFPRPAPEPLPVIQEVMLDELQPAPETPRIIEVAEPAEPEPNPIETYPDAALPQAEQMELLPSFADIRLEPAARLEEELEVIPRPAPLNQRIAAGMLDAAVVLMAGGLFALTFFKLAEEIPHSRLLLLCAVLTCGIFWLLFQYIFLTYGRTTPGMRVAQLELCDFSGGPASRLARQCRALASALSGFSAGLGYAWAFIDQDRLGWHDRITQTYVRFSGIPSGAREPYQRDNLQF